MTEFKYHNSSLYVEDVALEYIASKVGTPFYCYSVKMIKNNYEEFYNSLHNTNAHIHFSVKSNSNLAILKLLKSLGSGFDVVSGGELRRCMEIGAKPRDIVFSGVGKTIEELNYALDIDIGQINIESIEELYTLNKLALKKNKKACISFRINPDITAKTHKKISTGKKEDKFGIQWNDIIEIYSSAVKMKGLKVNGLTIHIGSQILDIEPFKISFLKIASLVQKLREKGLSVETIDLGGGIGINYNLNENYSKLHKSYGDIIKEIISPLNCKIILEPGRSILANAGILISKVIYNKVGESKNFLIIDAAMNDLLRPALYDAYHDIISVKESDKKIHFDVVGPICETGDIFAKNKILPNLQPNELLAIKSAGAYGSVMSSQYNSRLLIPEVLVMNSEFSIIRQRPKIEDLWMYDSIPEWID